MTHADRIEAMLRSAAEAGLPGQRHCAAWREPQPVEVNIVGFVRSAAAYADKNDVRGELGELWVESLRNTRDLLDGECGRLDRPTVEALILEMLKAEGFGESGTT